MSYKVRVGGVVVECASLDALDRLIERYNLDAEEDSPEEVEAEAAPAVQQPKRRIRGDKNLSEKTYIKHVWRLIRILLRTENRAVGKLTVSLADELKIKPFMFRRIIDKLRADHNFLTLTETSRGRAPYVRISDPEAAEAFAAEYEQKARELFEEEQADLGLVSEKQHA